MRNDTEGACTTGGSHLLLQFEQLTLFFFNEPRLQLGLLLDGLARQLELFLGVRFGRLLGVGAQVVGSFGRAPAHAVLEVARRRRFAHGHRAARPCSKCFAPNESPSTYLSQGRKKKRDRIFQKRNQTYGVEVSRGTDSRRAIWRATQTRVAPSRRPQAT